jgi:hypothetical protein
MAGAPALGWASTIVAGTSKIPVIGLITTIVGGIFSLFKRKPKTENVLLAPAQGTALVQPTVLETFTPALIVGAVILFFVLISRRN